MIYTLGSQLVETDMENVLLTEAKAVFLITEAQCTQVFRQLSVNVEMDTSLSQICFCKVESQQECLCGTLAIPRLLDVLGSRYRMAYVITEKYLILIDNDGFADRLVKRICRKKVHQGETKERFLYNFIAEFISRDTILLENFEQHLTMISTIFFPLTLITGWYGMNFENMPELKNGYPFIILFSILVVVGCIFLFKKKKIL